jgi:hypothetical protein
MGMPQVYLNNAVMGDDIGCYNPSIYHRGDMGYWTPQH